MGLRIFEISLPTYIGIPIAAEIASSAAAFLCRKYFILSSTKSKELLLFWLRGSVGRKATAGLSIGKQKEL